MRRGEEANKVLQQKHANNIPTKGKERREEDEVETSE